MTILEERRRPPKPPKRAWRLPSAGNRPNGRSVKPSGVERFLTGSSSDRPFDVGRKRSTAQAIRERSTVVRESVQHGLERSMSVTNDLSRDDRADRTLRSVALALTMAGMCMLLFLVYAFVFTGLQEDRAQRALLNAFQAPDRFKLLSGKPVPEGSPVAVLEIPNLGLKQVVVEGTSATDLLKGPGLMPDTAQPGTDGNSVIAGRRSTAGAPFASIGSLHDGDPITVVTALGNFRYRVEGGGIANIGTTDPISPTRTSRLTLVTSNPPVFPNGRAYVTAKLVSAPATAPLPTVLPNARERGLAGDAGAFWPSVLWGLILALAFTGTIVAYRRLPEQRWTVYLLSMPIVMACALVWFENVIRLLPATL